MEKKKYIIIGGNCLMSEDSFRDFNLANEEVEKAMARFIFPRNEWDAPEQQPGVEFVNPSDGIVKGISHQMREYADQEPVVWDRITRDDLDSIRNITIKSRRMGFEDDLQKIIFRDTHKQISFDLPSEAEKINISMVPELPPSAFSYVKRGSNYTKPKNRKKKK